MKKNGVIPNAETFYLIASHTDNPNTLRSLFKVMRNNFMIPTAKMYKEMVVANLHILDKANRFLDEGLSYHPKSEELLALASLTPK